MSLHAGHTLNGEQRTQFFRAFLSDLCKGGCETYTGPRAFNCFADGRTAFSGEGATSACVPCMARQILDAPESGTESPMEWAPQAFSRFTDFYVDRALRIAGFGPEPASPPTFHKGDLDNCPRVLVPPHGVVVFMPRTGWLHFKPATTEGGSL